MKYGKYFTWACVFVVVLLGSVVKAGKWEGLTWNTQYKNPLAYPRSPEFSLTWENFGDRGVIKAALGKDLGLITYQSDRLYVTLGLEFATWLTLGHRSESMAFPLITEDFIFSVPVSFRYNNFSGAIKYNHISAHLGDGSDEILNVNSFAYSREFVSLHLSHDSWFEDIHTKVYGHTGYLIVVMPEGLGRWFAGGGIEINVSKLTPDVYFAIDGTWNSDTESFDLSGQIGIWRVKKQDVDLDIRVAVTGYSGSDRRGQLLGKGLNNIGLGVFVR